MIRIPKIKPETWYGFEITEAECNCDLDNPEIRTKRIYKTEKERDRILNKLFTKSTYCYKKYEKFCTTLNREVKQEYDNQDKNHDMVNHA